LEEHGPGEQERHEKDLQGVVEGKGPLPDLVFSGKTERSWASLPHEREIEIQGDPRDNDEPCDCQQEEMRQI
jgi:hypothetical protein